MVLRYGERDLDVVVSDDGNGAGQGGGSGYGLAGIRERVAVLGGRLVGGTRREGLRSPRTFPLA